MGEQQEEEKEGLGVGRATPRKTFVARDQKRGTTGRGLEHSRLPVVDEGAAGRAGIPSPSVGEEKEGLEVGRPPEGGEAIGEE